MLKPKGLESNASITDGDLDGLGEGHTIAASVLISLHDSSVWQQSVTEEIVSPASDAIPSQAKQKIVRKELGTKIIIKLKHTFDTGTGLLNVANCPIISHIIAS